MPAIQGTAPSPPLALLAELTYLCPLKCAHCSNPVDFSRPRQELTTQEWLELFQQARALGAVQLGFSGGEPVQRPDLLSLIDGANALGYYTHLITSGAGLTEAKFASFRRAGLAHIQLSLQAAEADLNDRLAGSQGAFGRVQRLVRMIQVQNFPLTLNFVIHRHSISQLAQMIELATVLGAQRLVLSACQYVGWAARNRPQLQPTKAQWRQAKHLFRTLIPTLPASLSVRAEGWDPGVESATLTRGLWSGSALTITPEGFALPSQFAEDAAPLQHEPLPSVRKQSIQEIWTQSPLFRAWPVGQGRLVTCPQPDRAEPEPADLDTLRLRTKRNAKVLLRRC